jgi:serine protease Do
LSRWDEDAKRLLPDAESELTSDEITEAQQLAREFKPSKPYKLGSYVLNGSNTSGNTNSDPYACGSGFFITDDGYLISNYHVVKEAAKVRLVTSAGTVDAKVVQVDAANDLALLKADGIPRGATPLPIAASRSAHLGGTVATIGFPDPSLQGFSPNLANGKSRRSPAREMTRAIFKSAWSLQTATKQPCKWQDEHRPLAASGALPENVNYAVKSSLLLSFLESVPEVSAKLKTPNTGDEKFEEVVKSAQDAAVLVLVY